MNYEDIISVKNLFEAWQEFQNGKKKKDDVSEFALNLSKNIFSLHDDLKGMKYEHGGYIDFKINDPKPRDISKAIVRERLLHHAVYKILYPYFDQKFIFDSYSCRDEKGTHKANARFRDFGRKVSKNNTKQCWILKCDIRKFFASIDQEILIGILKKHIVDENIMWLLERIISSFHTTRIGVGLPLGNLTSQLFVNIYMNEFDQFMKHELKTKYYIRYADDFVIFSQDKGYLENFLLDVGKFLNEKLHLNLHPNKVFIETLSSGVDFLGWVHFPNHRVLRTSTKRKMFRNLKLKEGKLETIQSYLGMLKHGNAFELSKRL